MRVRIFTFRYSSTLGGFDDTPLTDFTRDKETLQFREHFFLAQWSSETGTARHLPKRRTPLPS